MTFDSPDRAFKSPAENSASTPMLFCSPLLSFRLCTGLCLYLEYCGESMFENSFGKKLRSGSSIKSQNRVKTVLTSCSNFIKL